MKRRLLVYMLLLLVLTTAPYVLAWAQQGEDWRFSGFLFGVEDGNSYLGKMRLGGRGIWDFYLFYTPEPHDAVPLVFLPYILPGQIVGRFVPETSPIHTTALILTYHLMRLVCDALLIVVLDRFIARFVHSEWARLMALILATVGGGLGWLLTFMGATAPEFYIPEGFGFLVLFGLPHLALARAALLSGLLLVMKSAEDLGLRTELKDESEKSKEQRDIEPPGREGRQVEIHFIGSEPDSRHDIVVSLQTNPPLSMIWRGGRGVKYAFLAGLCWLVVGLAVPFYLTVIYCILGAWGLATWLRQRAFPTTLFMHCLVAAGITVPLFFHYAIAFSTNPAFAVWSAQNQLPSPSPLHYLLAYSILGIPALLGAKWAWQQARQQIRYALLVGWVVIVPLLVYLPLNVQRRLSEAVIVPLAVLAAIGLERWIGERKVRRFLAQVWVGAACLSAVLLLFVTVSAAVNPSRPLFLPAAEVTALDWLNGYAPAEAVVLSSGETGNVLPAYTHLRPFIGHGPETLEWQRKTGLVEAFFANELMAEQRAALYGATCLETQPTLCAAPIRYLIYGPLERAYADTAPNWQAEWTLIYDVSGVQIYERSGEDG